MARVVFVTGASGDIGGAIAQSFARLGDRVALGCNAHPEKAEALAEALCKDGLDAMVCRGNVADPAAVEEMFAQVRASFGEVQVLVNNAGFAQQKLAQDITAEEWDAMLGAHTKGAHLCSRAALPAMLRQRAGCILNISSVWGQVGASCEAHYSAAKAGMIGYTKALAKEVGPSGVRVNCIAPGAIETGMLEAFTDDEKQAICDEIPLGRLGAVQDIAAAAVFLSSPAAGYITGQVLGVNGGMAM